MEEVTLTDRIYEAAIIPELWQDVCVSLAEKVDGYSACLIAMTAQGGVQWVCSPNIQPEMERYSKSELRFQNVRPQRSMITHPLVFSRDIDVMTQAELAEDAIYNEFLRPLGLGWSMGAVIPEPSGHTLIFDLIRRTDLGPFEVSHLESLNAIRGDLARAALMSSRMVFQYAHTMAATLSMIGLPVAVISDDNRVVAMNPEMEALAPRIRIGAGNRLSLEQPPANALLQEGLEQVRKFGAGKVQSIPLTATDTLPALILHVLPVRRNARDIFARSFGLVIATPVGLSGPPDLRVLGGLFDLTPGEARVAREIASGASLDVIALSIGLTLETVRTYLKRIFLKTGTRRQAELTLLLSGLGRIV